MAKISYLPDEDAAKRSREHPRKESRKERLKRLAKQVEEAISAGLVVQRVPAGKSGFHYVQGINEPIASGEPWRKRKSKKDLYREIDELRERLQGKNSFYHSREWRELRWKVLTAGDGKCVMCGRGKKDGIILHVDHIKPRSKYPHLELEFSNLQVLCEDCNLGKSNT